MFKKINRGESQQKDNHFFPSKGKKLLLISLVLFKQRLTPPGKSC